MKWDCSERKCISFHLCILIFYAHSHFHQNWIERAEKLIRSIVITVLAKIVGKHLRINWSGLVLLGYIFKFVLQAEKYFWFLLGICLKLAYFLYFLGWPSRFGNTDTDLEYWSELNIDLLKQNPLESCEHTNQIL